MEQLGQGTQQHAPQAPQSLLSYQVPLISITAVNKGKFMPIGTWAYGILVTPAVLLRNASTRVP